jgi:colicin import membrane protein
MSTLAFGERYEPGYGRSFALAFAIHAVLIAVMFFGVRMQSYQPETVSVELWEPPPLPAPVVEPPKLEPRPEPKVEPEPPKPEPKIEKPQIVEKPAPKPKPKAEPKPKPPPPVAKPKPVPRDLELEKRAREEVAREQGEFRERQAREQAAREQATARDRAMAAWISKISNKIRSNVNLPPDLAGNPEAIFDVALLPTGEILTVRMRKSSGHRGYDEAVERAILKSSPLPKPEPASLFVRQLELRFRPKDQ